MQQQSMDDWNEAPEKEKCSERCPISEIVWAMPKFEEVLELYYHCKLCSAPEAYLQQDSFLEHVQQEHPEYLESDAEQKVFYIYSDDQKTASTQSEVLKEEVGIKKENVESGEEEEEEEPGACYIQFEKSTEPATEEELIYAAQEDENQHRSNEQSAPQQVEALPPEVQMDLKQQSVPIKDSNILSQFAAAAAAGSSGASNEMELIIEWDGQNNMAATNDLADQILGAIQQHTGEPIIRDQKVIGHAEPEFNQVSAALPAPEQNLMPMQFQSIEDKADVLDEPVKQIPPGACTICHEVYKHRHHSSCQRPHRANSEKPSCDAYVCCVGRNERVYACLRCDRVFLKRPLYFRHMEEHAEALQLVRTCDKCNESFRLRFELVKHMMRCRGVLTYVCRKCQKTFTNKQNLIRHLKIHDGIKEHVCEYCDKAFHSKTSLIIHVRNHTGEKPFKCHSCPMAFKTRSHLIRHSYVHDESKRFVCDVCGLKYCDKSALVRHSKVHSAGGKPRQYFPCETCKKVLSSKRQLTDHMMTFHSGIDPEQLKVHKCSYCTKRFRTKRNVLHHEMIHKGIKPFVCTMCGKAFYKKTDLVLHERVHTGEKPYNCRFCGRAFSNPSNLQKHTYIHTGERPYSCTMCDRSFNDRSHLTRHIRVHTGEKPFECPQCDRRFSVKQQLKQHMLLHSDYTPFACELCGKTFRQKAKAQRHRCNMYMTSNNMSDSFADVLQNKNTIGPNHVIVNEAGEPIQIGASNVVLDRTASAEEVILQVVDNADDHYQGDQIAIQVIEPGGDSEHVAYHVLKHPTQGVSYRQVMQPPQQQ